MKVLAGGPTREVGSDIFQAHTESLGAQIGFEVTVRHEMVPDDDPERRWTVGKVERVARVRQEFLDTAEREWDALFMVDTDILVGPTVLKRMWDTPADVVYGVFWSVWPGYDTPMPQVWDVHPYGWTETCISGLVHGETVTVYGGGACTLIRGEGFRSRYWPLLRGLRASGGMWAGEDRSYCLGLECRDIRQLAVAGLPIVHLYTDDQRTPEALEHAKAMLGLGD